MNRQQFIVPILLVSLVTALGPTVATGLPLEPLAAQAERPITDFIRESATEGALPGLWTASQGEERRSGDSARTQVDQAFSSLPLRFVANVGQSDPSVRFTVKGAGHTIFFTEEEVVFEDYEWRLLQIPHRDIPVKPNSAIWQSDLDTAY